MTRRGSGHFVGDLPRWLLVVLVMVTTFGSLGIGDAHAQDPRVREQVRERVPGELEPWVDWVAEHDVPTGDCRNVGDTVVCVWPTRLSLNLDADGGAFELEVIAHADEEFVELPGDDDAWPQDVRVDGKPALVLQRGGTPQVQLGAGAHRVQGRFLWRDQPDALALPGSYALIDLVVGGTRITFPSRGDGYLDIPLPELDAALPEPDEPVEPDEPDEPVEPDEPEPDSEEVEVSRLLTDGVPLEVTTRVDLRISGKDRELVLPYPLWKGARLLRIDSDLPVTLDEDRALKIKARRGSHTITLVAHLPESPDALAAPALAEPWPDREIWVWNALTGPAAEGQPSMGQVSVTGAKPVDRTRTHAPASWPGGATFEVTPKSPLKFEVLQRGMSETATSHLALRRTAVLDRSGEGWYLSDTLDVELKGKSRLDLVAGQLGSAVVAGEPQVITMGSDGNPGVEVRQTSAQVLAQWHASGDASSLPLAGWSEPIEEVSMDFRIPRGWDLLRADGPARTSETWIERWNPLDVVLLLLACVAVGLWVDWTAGAVALVGLTLTYASNDDAFIPLLVLVAGMAGLRKLMDRPLGEWASWGTRSAWLLAAFVYIAWVVLFIPDGLERVFVDGAPALGDLRFERAFDTLAGLSFTALFLVGLTAGLSVGLAQIRMRGVSPRLIVPAVAVVGALALGLVFASTGGNQMLSAGADKQVAATSAAEPPPPPVEEMVEEEMPAEPMAAAAPMDDAMPAKNKRAYAMREKSDEDDAWDGLEGTEVGEAYGVGGLGLVGTGRGGGGTGEGTIGLGNTGLIGKGGGGGTGSGYGRGSGAGFGGEGKRVPQVRQRKAQVTGDLDGDIVRRIVRAHINEVRACYNTGLSSNPNLSGDVTVRFVIGSDGKVSASSVKSQTLGDGTVAGCIAKAVKRWKFPKPAGGGNVSVDYPFALSPGGANEGLGGDGQGLADAEPTRYVESEELPEAPPPEIPQTGRAMPEWSGRVFSVQVDRSLEGDEVLSLWLLSPSANQVIALLRALCLAALAVLLVRRTWPRLLVPRTPADTDDGGGDRDGPARRAKTAAGAVALLLTLGLPVQAFAAPPNELLEELGRRVNADPEPAPSPDCGQNCALVARLDADLEDDTLTLEIELHMAGPGVYWLPGSLATWAPTSVLVDRRPASALVARDGRVLLRMDEGLHRLTLSGPVAGDSLNLGLSTAPKRVTASVEGWSVSGIDEADTATTLVFARHEGRDAVDPVDPDAPVAPDTSTPETPTSEQPTDDAKTNQDLPAWLAVERRVEIGPRWTVRTTVRRLNAGPSAVTLRVPLLEGEKMIESSAKIDDPKATVTLERSGEIVSWVSVLDERETLVLEAPAEPKWTETWVFSCGAAWQCNASGVPTTARNGAARTYHPWPGEKLQVALFKPTPAEGARLSVDEARLDLSLSDAGTDAGLFMKVRTSTVGERTLTLPASAHLERVEVDGAEIPTAKDSAEIRLTFQPGVHEVRVDWKQDEGLTSAYTTPAVSLGGEAMNVEVHVRIADDLDRVLLRTGGSATGPTVWIWAWVLAIAALAGFLHWITRDRPQLREQVGLHDWFLLGLGFPVAALPVVLAWFLVVGQRRDHLAGLTRVEGDGPADRRYNVVQMMTILLTLAVALAALMTAKTLLTEPVPTLAENLMYGDVLTWYADRVDDAIPQGKVLSLHVGIWRAVWIGWVVWFGWRAVHWSRWAVAEVRRDGWLRWPAPVAAEDSASVAQLDDANAPRPSHGALETQSGDEDGAGEPTERVVPADDPATLDEQPVDTDTDGTDR